MILAGKSADVALVVTAFDFASSIARSANFITNTAAVVACIASGVDPPRGTMTTLTILIQKTVSTALLVLHRRRMHLRRRTRPHGFYKSRRASTDP